MAHRANATAKYGIEAARCVAADDPPIAAAETLDLDFANYPGGIALWGSVPAVYDTTTQLTDRGIHVHARSVKASAKDVDKTYRRPSDLLSDGWAEVGEIDAINYMVSGVFGFDTVPVNRVHCGFPHLDRDWFAVHAHRKPQCHGCGKQFSDTYADIGNSSAALRTMLAVKRSKMRRAADSISIRQADYPGGIQIWGSNPAILWTSADPDAR